MRSAAALVVVALAAGCSQPFGPQTLVYKPRMLAIRAEPPEVEPESLWVDFDLLVATASGDADLRKCRWAACLIDLGWASGSIDCPGEGSLTFSTSCHGARLEVNELVDWLADYDRSGLGGAGNLGQFAELSEQRLPIFIGVEVEVDGTVLTGIKRLRLNLEGDEPNHNPTLLGIEVVEGPSPGGIVSVGQQVRFRPLVSGGSPEVFRDPDTGEPRTEDMLFSWFSNAGEFDERRTVLDTDHEGNPLDVNTWRLTPQWSSPGPVWVWVVARDGRWGADWTSVGFELEQGSPP